MPLVLTQHASRDLNRYLDREGVIYHFPANYLPVVQRVQRDTGDHRFLYQRPIREAPRGQAGTYFAHGILGTPYEDVATPNHYWMDVLSVEPLAPVPLRSESGTYYETGSTTPMNLRGRSIRYIDPMAYYAILNAGRAFSRFPEPQNLQDAGVFAPAAMPRDAFRDLLVVPPGTGYVPRGDELPDPHEAAALHERARADHQSTLDLLASTVRARGGVCFYNNNVDLYARLGEERLLVEVKSVARGTSVNRMRYGMGQLLDYRVRYRSELAGAQPVLAFGSPPDRDASWVREILQGNDIAFVVREGRDIVPVNDVARRLTLFSS